MNYRHAYHAGNFADVFKHAALALVLDHLKAKDKPFAVIDSHAGTGFYDLAGDEALRTGEAETGIARLMQGAADDPLLASYLDAVRALNPDGGVRHYPGSPAIVRHMMRDHDRLIAVELHPEDGKSLAVAFDHDRRVFVRQGDGYAALKAALPPKERRGVVLIDPPFEAEDEFQKAASALKEGLRRWETGIFAVWYPVKAQGLADRFLAEVAGLPRPSLAAEFLMRPADDGTRLNGSGLCIVNPPYRLAETLKRLCALLGAGLGASGSSRVMELRGE